MEEPLLRPPTPPSPPNRLAAALGRAAGRRGPAAAVRESAAQQLARRRAEWAYSRPVVALDMGWNLAFAAAAAAVLFATSSERPTVPLRVWVVGYALQCLVHVAMVWSEYKRRRRSEVEARSGDGGGGDEERSSTSSDEELEQPPTSFTKRCESLNTLVSFLWWIIGFYWVVNGGDALMQDAPRLYWLSLIFLSFDVFFCIFFVAVACFIGIALCCCLPCIIAILYAVAGQEGASDADIGILPRYKYSEPSEDGQKGSDGVMVPILNNSGTSTSERILLREDAECCICLSSYEDGVELCSLPCNHHFHSTCIVKWMRIHATCPLCKYNILKGSDTV